MPTITPKVRNAWMVLRETVRESVESGYRKAHKHTDRPVEEHIFNTIEQYVMDGLAEEFDVRDQ